MPVHVCSATFNSFPGRCGSCDDDDDEEDDETVRLFSAHRGVDGLPADRVMDQTQLPWISVTSASMEPSLNGPDLSTF